ncbi:MAG: hypothetical protein MHM6MM_001663 [Cercozoa sp. M6MM]
MSAKPAQDTIGRAGTDALSKLEKEREQEFRQLLSRSKRGQVSNRSAASAQVTAEQLVREAMERREEMGQQKMPEQKIMDQEELAMYQQQKRQGFEAAVRKERQNIGAWLKYAAWEERQKEFRRARSVFERALEIDSENSHIWTRYAEMEMRTKNANLARNVFDRAVSLLPRVDQLWYKYAHLEVTLDNWEGARNVYERWMKWRPESNAWLTYIKFMKRASGRRHERLEGVRDVYKRYVACHNTKEAFLHWARYERRQGEFGMARRVFATALDALDNGKEKKSGRNPAHDKDILLAYAALEKEAKEYERARGIYRFALDALPKSQAQEVFRKYASFEKQHGDRHYVEKVLAAQRRFELKETLLGDKATEDSRKDYDVWFDWARLEQSLVDDITDLSHLSSHEAKQRKAERETQIARVREVYEQAVANVPDTSDLREWKRYIWLWLRYAIFEELSVGDAERARKVWLAALDTVPHDTVQLPRLWIMYAHFEVRHGNLSQARAALGQAIGRLASDKLPEARKRENSSLFRGYIDMETRLHCADRARRLYEKWLETDTSSSEAWLGYAEFEQQLGEQERGMGILSLAMQQAVLDAPELVWKAAIDAAIAHAPTKQEGEQQARELFEQLLERSKHLRVWQAAIAFEVEHAQQPQRARALLQRANEHLRTIDSPDARAQRKELLEMWLEFEEDFGDDRSIDQVAALQPVRVEKSQRVGEFDEVVEDWQFPDEDTSKAKSEDLLANLLAAADEFETED